MKRLLAMVALVGCDEPRTEFACTGNASCRDGDLVGVCEENGFCSFEDTSCPEGRRYGAFAGAALGDQCVVASAPAIGDWKPTAQLPVPRYSLATATDGNTIYAIGGIAGPTAFGDVWIADAASGGAFGGLAAWTQGPSLPTTRRSFGLAAFGGYVYAIAGRTGVEPFTQTVLAARFDGGTPAWNEIEPLPGGLRCVAIAQSGNTVYVLGGKTFTDGVTDVVIGTLADGAVTWRPGPPMQRPRFCHSATVVGDHLYAIGGCPIGNNGCPNLLADVEVARIESDGSLGAWVDAGPLPEPRWHHTSAGNAHYLVVAGGRSTSGANTPTVLVTHVNPDGSLGAWREATPLLQGGSGRKSAVVVGEQMFLIGTDTEVATLRAAPL